MRYGAVLFALFVHAAVAQEVTVTHYDHVAARDKLDTEAWQQQLRRSKAKWDIFNTERGITRPEMDHAVELEWPLREAITVSDNTVQQTSFFLDHDDSGGIQDWNCGERSYDGHNGVDIGPAPYAWYRMRRDQLIVIAAADGVITDMVQDQPEDSCEANTIDGDNNFITIEHEDGSWAVYAHMRTDSLTRKSIGDSVEAGEYLGVVGSAGISTGPHLHFGVGFWEQDGNVLRFVEQDPWQGNCNLINAESWWAEQPDYLQPAFMGLATHSDQPTNPPCPESEEPHYSNSFSAGDQLFWSFTVRDALAGQMADWAILQPNGSPAYQGSQGSSSNDTPGGRTWTFAAGLPGNASSGEWQLEVVFDGQTYTHSFWVDASPPNPDHIPVANNQYNGLWYDSLLDGEGYNFITSPNGTVIFFYGSDERGNRFWLISETIGFAFQAGQTHTIVMYESTGGIHSAPMKSARGLSVWGTLRLTMDDCGSGKAVLDGVDGKKTSNIVKLAAVPGTVCGDGNRADAAQSGLWYFSGLDGEGYNLIVARNGVVVFYYGFDRDGNRLWLISETIPDIINGGNEIVATVYKANSGTFDAPVPSKDSLEVWGTLTIKVNGCNTTDFTLDTQEGDKLSETVRLAGILGVNCS